MKLIQRKSRIFSYIGLLTMMFLHTVLHAGTFTPTSLNGVTSVSGSITSNGQTGTYTLTRTASSGYNQVNFQGGSNGIQAANQNSTADPDSFTFSLNIVPPPGYLAQISFSQSNYNNSGGNNEASDITATWAGGDSATVSDTSPLTRDDDLNNDGFGPDSDFPPYTGATAGCPAFGTVFETDGTQHQIEDVNDGDTISSGDTLLVYAVDNNKDVWEVTLPAGVNSMQ